MGRDGGVEQEVGLVHGLHHEPLPGTASGHMPMASRWMPSLRSARAPCIVRASMVTCRQSNRCKQTAHRSTSKVHNGTPRPHTSQTRRGVLRRAHRMAEDSSWARLRGVCHYATGVGLGMTGDGWGCRQVGPRLRPAECRRSHQEGW